MKPIEVVCSFCKAVPGEWCISKKGKSRVYAHTARQSLAEKMSEEPEPIVYETEPEPISESGLWARMKAKFIS